MKLSLQIRQFQIFLLLLFFSYTSAAQTRLIVNGAKINMVKAVYLNTNAISVSGDGLVNVAGSTLKVANSITSTGAIDVSNGTMEMTGTAAQEIPANSLTGNVIKNLTINSTDKVTIGGPLALTDVLTLSGGSLSSAGTLTLKSISTKTARVAPVTSTAAVPVDGNVVAERYISSKRAFRFLTAPVNTTGNIRANWMENTNNPSIYVNNNPVPDYGTHITGIGGGANGFDATITNNSSLFTYDNVSQAWIAATNTNNTLNVGAAYRILVRGSRSTDISQAAPPSSVTTLRATGTLATGTIVMAKPGGGGTAGMPNLSNITGGYSMVGNPYASPVDWVLIEKSNISNTIYIWDPTLSGTNGRGAYVTYNSSTGVSNIASLVDNNIQSGQSFFIQTTSADPVLTFKEVHKSVVHRAVFREPNRLPHISLQLLLPGQDTIGGAADGLAAYFSEGFSNKVGDEDSYKLTNLDENVAIARDGSLLSIEARKQVNVSDTLPLKIWQLLPKKYLFKSVLTNFSPDIDTYLEDAYSHASTKLNNQSVTIVPFTISADTLSFAKNRFKIVFKGPAALAVIMSNIKAYEKNNGVEVNWTTQSGSSTDKYIVEKSFDTHTFTPAGSVNANTSSAANTLSVYNWFDENPFDGDNYYRVKSIEKSGDPTYSKIVKVYIDRDGIISVTMGPVKSNSFNIVFKNVRKGKHSLGLINNLGQKVYSGEIFHTGGSGSRVIKLKNILPVGIYHLQISGNDKLRNIPVLIQ